MVHHLPWDIINMICVSIKENRDENVRYKVQAWIGKDRTNHIARFDLFFLSEFPFFYLDFFSLPFSCVLGAFFLGDSQNYLRLCCCQCAIVGPVRILCLFHQ